MRGALPLLAAACLAASAPAAAAEGHAAARLEFLEGRLDEGRVAARAWQRYWTAADLAGIAAGAFQIAAADDRGGLASGVVDAGKSTLALVDLLRSPAPGLRGADPVRALGDEPSTLDARVAAAEGLLEEALARRDVNYTVAGHAKVLTTNLLGGAVVAALGGAGPALRSTLTGIAFGELQIWTEPWRARADLDDYRRRFGPAAVELRPLAADAGVTGLALALRF